MKRGLVVLDPAETPAGELAGRVETLQRRLRDRELAAALVYGDVYRSGDIAYLSNMCVYWDEGILAVPARGAPAYLTKLSPRVHPWMRATSCLTDLRSGRDLARLAADYLAGAVSGGPVGLVEMGWWPQPLIGELGDLAAGCEWTDLGPVVRRERQAPSTAERALLAAGAALTARAVADALACGGDNPERAGVAEFTARNGGVEDVLVHCQSAAGEADTIEVVSEYRGYWTTAARVTAPAAPGWAPPLADAWRAGERALRAGVGADQVRAAMSGPMAAFGGPWRVGLVHHTDLETGGGYLLEEERVAPVADGAVAAMRLELSLADGSQAVVADTYEIRASGARPLTAGLPGPVAEGAR